MWGLDFISHPLVARPQVWILCFEILCDEARHQPAMAVLLSTQARSVTSNGQGISRFSKKHKPCGVSADVEDTHRFWRRAISPLYFASIPAHGVISLCVNFLDLARIFLLTHAYFSTT
jgi:hypothetical protein